MMLSNADVTFYSAKDYTRHTAHKAYFTDNRGQTVKKNGIEISDVVLVYLYTDEYVPSVGDIVVRGLSILSSTIHLKKLFRKV